MVASEWGRVKSNAVALRLCQLSLPVGTPFIVRPFCNPVLGRSRLHGTIVFNRCNLVEDFGKDSGGFLPDCPGREWPRPWPGP